MVEDNKKWTDFQDDEADYIPCEQRTREQCSSEGTKMMYLSTNGNAAGAAVEEARQFPECVASPISPGNDNPYKIASVAYLADKTDLSVGKALCRYAGGVRTKECFELYEPVQFGHANDGNKHIGYQFKGTAANDGYPTDHDIAPSVNFEDEEDEPFDEDPEGVADEGGKFWARVTHQDQYIEEKLNINRHNLQPADVEFMSAFAVAAYARKISNNGRYTPQSGEDYDGENGHVDLTEDLEPEQEDNRAALLDAIPGTCFSPGVSGNLLYQEGWGAAYFSLGILLVYAIVLMRASEFLPVPFR